MRGDGRLHRVVKFCEERLKLAAYGRKGWSKTGGRRSPLWTPLKWLLDLRLDSAFVELPLPPKFFFAESLCANLRFVAVPTGQTYTQAVLSKGPNARLNLRNKMNRAINEIMCTIEIREIRFLALSSNRKNRLEFQASWQTFGALSLACSALISRLGRLCYRIADWSRSYPTEGPPTS